jgi:pimeloyl-ACP methyl ester carboxylesterase
MRATLAATAAAFLLGACASLTPDGALVTTEHMVPAASTAPSMQGQQVRLYVREVAPAVRPGAGPAPVVVFVHGAGTPAEVSFDSRRADYSWLAYVARAGFDVFSVDMTGYGRSSRPAAMDDPCNLSREAQARFIPALIPAPCSPSHPRPITTMSSDWDDLDAVVDHVRRLRGVDRVSLVGWSQGGPRIAGFTALHPAKVHRIVVLAPAYARTSPAAAPSPLPDLPATLTVQSQSDFVANWDRQVGCRDQYDPAAAAQIWQEMQESDPAGARWGPGVRRAPAVPTWGFNQATVARMQAPFLMVTGEHDKQVAPDRVRELYADWGGRDKVLVEMGCSSHNAMWETHRRLLYQATVDWLRDGRLQGLASGVIRMGY